MSQQWARFDKPTDSGKAFEEQGMDRLSLYWKHRPGSDSTATLPRAGIAGPAPKDTPKSMREQYGISAMLYGLVVLLGGIYCAMTDAGRLASEQGFAIDAAAWAGKVAAARSERVTPAKAVSLTPIPTPLPRAYLSRPGDEKTNRSKDSVPAAMVPHTHLEDASSTRYVKPRDGA